MLVILLGVVAWQQPDQIPYPPAANYIKQFKSSPQASQVLGATITAPDSLDKAQQYLQSVAKTTKLPTSLTGLPEEVVVEDVMKNITGELKKLPEKEAEKLKVQFCQDVIAQSGQGNETNHDSQE